MATTSKRVIATALVSAIATTMLIPTASAAAMADPEPIVVWDGAKTAYNFSTLTKKVDNNTYTLNLNEMNSVAADGSYVQIGSDNAKAAVTITAVNNDDSSVTNAFGTDGTVTVIMKYTDLPVSAGSNRALISLLDSQKYKGGNPGNDNSVKIGVSKWGGDGYFIWQGGYAASFSGVSFVDTEQTAALAYNNLDGTVFYLDSVAVTNTSLKARGYTTPCGIALGGVDTDGSTQYFALTGMKIKAVAVFTDTLTAEQIANYKFPSEAPLSDSLVSEINDIFGSEDEIDVFIADGAIIIGDTTFNASTVRFHCNGSFELIPPEGNTAVLDFSDVKGQPVIIYDGLIPEKSGNTFTSNSVPTYVTDSTQWTGTVWLKNKANIANFNPNNFGNSASTLRLFGISAYFPSQTTPLEISPAIELVDDSDSCCLDVNNGFSRDANAPERYIVINKLKGDGKLKTSSSADKVLMNVLDWSEFTGKIQVENKIVVFGAYVPSIAEFNTSGAIYIGTNVTVTLPAAKQWQASNGIHVFGTFKATGIGDDQIHNDTSVITYDSGTFVLMTNSDADDLDVNYSRITGTGTLCYEGTGYRTISRSNFPTTMTVENNLSNRGLIHRVPNAELSIGSLSGNGRMRSDWGGSGSVGDRDLRILQSKDTTYDGMFDAALDRINNVIVASGASSTGTLTITGMQTANNNLVIESGAKVNLTGTWVGATTVAGTFSGTGTVDGDFTLSDGATLKVDDIADLLSVSGALTASSGTVTIDLPAGTSKDVGAKFVEVDGTITLGAAFNVTVDGAPTRLKVIKTAGGLKAAPMPFSISVR